MEWKQQTLAYSPYYNVLVGKFSHAEFQTGRLPVSLLFSIFTFSLSPSCHYLSLTGQYPPNWSIQIHTGPLPVHFYTASRFASEICTEFYMSPLLNKTLPHSTSLRRTASQGLNDPITSPFLSCTNTCTQSTQL